VPASPREAAHRIRWAVHPPGLCSPRPFQHFKCDQASESNVTQEQRAIQLTEEIRADLHAARKRLAADARPRSAAAGPSKQTSAAAAAHHGSAQRRPAPPGHKPDTAEPAGQPPPQGANPPTAA